MKNEKVKAKKEIMKKIILWTRGKIIFFKKMNFLEKFRKSKMVMRKTYQKKKWEEKLIVILIVVLFLIIFFGIIFLAKKKNESPSLISKKSAPVKTESLGEVIKADSMDESFPFNGEIISQGRFVNVEQLLKGKALFIKSSEGIFLRLENFEMVNGQDMHIYLSPILNLDRSDVIDLGLMKSTAGNVNYEVDKSIDLDKYYNVLIWSDRFNAFFGYASLQKGGLPPEVDPSGSMVNNAEKNDEKILK